MTTLGNPLLLGGEGYQIERSVRLRSSASAYFNRTPASAGSQTTWTMSMWVKRGALGVRQFITMSGVNPNPSQVWQVEFDANNKLDFYNQTINTYRRTTQVFRDSSAWYHIVFGADTNNATAQNRFRCWVNGVEVTAWDVNSTISSGYTFAYNGAYLHGIGAYTYSGNSLPFDGYLTEVNFIDGQALTPSSFGETDAVTGVWKPKKYAGTYGTNGFYLNFSDPSAATAAAIGKDYSGNGNNWTPNNISVTAGVTYDSMLDVPTLYADGGNGRGNYAVLNPLWKDATSTINNANLTFSGGNYAGISTLVMDSGKWYFEATVTTATSTMYVSITEAPFAYGGNINLTNGGGAYSYSYYSNGQKWVLGTASAYGTSWGTVGDVIGAALDLDANTITFYRNNVSQGSISIGSGKSWVFGLSNATSTGAIAANFGQRPFAYTPPTGFKALNTQNLPEPTIKKGNQYFDVSLYTGNGSSGGQTITNSGAMQPDFVWLKARSLAGEHQLFDAVRGGTKYLVSNNTNAEQTGAGITFNSNGFALAGAQYNDNAMTVAAWQWKESPSAGFDIVTYTGTGGVQTVNHSLGVAPKMIIIKSRSAVSNWETYHASLGAAYYVVLDGTNAQINSTVVWNNTSPTSSVFSVGTGGNNTNGATYVAYLFAEVAGFSKFGSYTGNGSADGAFVFTGFRPRYVMIKNISTTGDWWIVDTARSTVNVASAWLNPNLSNAESSAISIDLLSNGFKFRSAAGNDNGQNWIYAAFAESPFRNSLAR